MKNRVYRDFLEPEISDEGDIYDQCRAIEDQVTKRDTIIKVKKRKLKTKILDDKLRKHQVSSTIMFQRMKVINDKVEGPTIFSLRCLGWIFAFLASTFSTTRSTSTKMSGLAFEIPSSRAIA